MRQAAAGATRIAHITDAHTTRDGRPTTVLKHRAVEILDDMVSQIRARDPDAILFGGDNIDNRGSGERDLDAFAELTAPLSNWRCVPGNHEASGAKPGRITKAAFQRRFATHGVPVEAPGFCWTVGDVRIIGLDTTLVGKPGGFVAPDGMAFLADALNEATEAHVVVLGHHLLVPSWAPYPFHTWADDYLVKNHEDVRALLHDHPKVRAYLCGHHHAHRVTPVPGRSGGGFYQIMTGSPVAYPHCARVLTLAPQGIEVETIRPSAADVVEEGWQAVLLGRKALRFAELGASDQFQSYLAGEPADNQALLPYGLGTPRRRALPRAASR